MIALRRPEIEEGYCWQISDEYHYVPTLPELIIELGRKEASGFKVRAYQVSSVNDIESLSLLYSTEYSRYAKIDIFQDGVVSQYVNMRAIYAFLASLKSDFEITYSANRTGLYITLPSNFLIECIYFKIEITHKDLEQEIDWFKEGF